MRRCSWSVFGGQRRSLAAIHWAARSPKVPRGWGASCSRRSTSQALAWCWASRLPVASTAFVAQRLAPVSGSRPVWTRSCHRPEGSCRTLASERRATPCHHWMARQMARQRTQEALGVCRGPLTRSFLWHPQRDSKPCRHLESAQTFRMASPGPHRPTSEPSPIRTERTEPPDPHRVDGAKDGSRFRPWPRPPVLCDSDRRDQRGGRQDGERWAPRTPAGRRHGLGAWRHLHHGFGRALPRGGAGTPGHRRRVLDGSLHGHQP